MCHFVGTFSSEERAAICTRLRSLQEAVERVPYACDVSWRVEHTTERDEGESYRVRHLGSKAELWGRSVERLCAAIDRTTGVIRRARRT